MKFIINTAKFIKETDKEIDGNNFLVAYDVPIAKTGIQRYSREEIGAEGDPTELVNVFRDSSVFDSKEVIESFDGIPIVYQHPDDGKVTHVNFKDFVVGTVSGVYYKNGDLFAKKLTIIDKDAIKNVLQKNTNELSIGFRGTIVKEKGNYKGTAYDYKENIIHANHLALCESGKAGPYYAINSMKKGKSKMEYGKEESDCMNEGDVSPKNVEGLIQQEVKKQLSKVKPYLKDSDDEDMIKDSEESEEELSKKEKEMENKTSEELTKSEDKDKDLIHAYKNGYKKLKNILEEKNKEIKELELVNFNLEAAFTEAEEQIKRMAKNQSSKNLVNALTGPDVFFTGNNAVGRDLGTSLNKAFILK